MSFGDENSPIAASYTSSNARQELARLREVAVQIEHARETEKDELSPCLPSFSSFRVKEVPSPRASPGLGARALRAQVPSCPSFVVPRVPDCVQEPTRMLPSCPSFIAPFVKAGGGVRVDRRHVSFAAPEALLLPVAEEPVVPAVPAAAKRVAAPPAKPAARVRPLTHFSVASLADPRTTYAVPLFAELDSPRYFGMRIRRGSEDSTDDEEPVLVRLQAAASEAVTAAAAVASGTASEAVTVVAAFASGAASAVSASAVGVAASEAKAKVATAASEATTTVTAHASALLGADEESDAESDAESEVATDAVAALAVLAEQEKAKPKRGLAKRVAAVRSKASASATEWVRARRTAREAGVVKPAALAMHKFVVAHVAMFVASASRMLKARMIMDVSVPKCDAPPQEEAEILVDGQPMRY